MYLKLGKQGYFDTLTELLILVTLDNALPAIEFALSEAGDLGLFAPLGLDLARVWSVPF